MLKMLQLKTMNYGKHRDISENLHAEEKNGFVFKSIVYYVVEIAFEFTLIKATFMRKNIVSTGKQEPAISYLAQRASRIRSFLSVHNTN